MGLGAWCVVPGGFGGPGRPAQTHFLNSPASGRPGPIRRPVIRPLPAVGTFRVSPDHIVPDFVWRNWSGFRSELLYLGIPVFGNCFHRPVAVRLHGSPRELVERDRSDSLLVRSTAQLAEEKRPGSEQVRDARTDDGTSGLTNLVCLDHLSGTSFRTARRVLGSQVTRGSVSSSR